MMPIYTLTLRQLSGPRRLIVLAVLAALPVVITAFMASSAHASSVADFERTVLSAMLAGSILPLVVLAIGGAAFADEVEDRTLANLTLSSSPRWQIVLPKLLATITIAAPFIAASALATAYIAYLGDVRAALAVTLAALAAVALYAAAFVWLGLVTTQAVGLGLLYIVIWEGFFAGFIEGVRMLSIRHYALALMRAVDPRRFAGAGLVDTPVALAVCALLLGGFTWLSVHRLRRMDVP